MNTPVSKSLKLVVFSIASCVVLSVAAQTSNYDLAVVDRVVKSRGGKIVSYGPCPVHLSVVRFRNKVYCADLPSTTTGLVGVESSAPCCEFSSQESTQKVKQELAKARKQAAAAQQAAQRATAQAAAAKRVAYQAQSKAKKNSFWDLKASTVFNGLLQVGNMYSDIKQTELKTRTGLFKSLDADQPNIRGETEAPWEVEASSAEGAVTKDLAVRQSPMSSLPAGDAKNRIKLYADRADATYMLGDQVGLILEVAKDSFITMFDTGASGKVHMIFPNKYQANNFVKAGDKIEIPGPDSGFDFVAGGPAGTDLITVIASDDDHDFTAEVAMTKAGPFVSIEKDVESFAKDLQVQVQKPDMAEYGIAAKEIQIVTQ